jgi:hypothetical protein
MRFCRCCSSYVVATVALCAGPPRSISRPSPGGTSSGVCRLGGVPCPLAGGFFYGARKALISDGRVEGRDYQGAVQSVSSTWMISQGGRAERGDEMNCAGDAYVM